jgi:hypothetical protein
MLMKLLIAGFLLAHGSIHAGFVSPRPPVTAGGPPWPFDINESWVLRSLGVDPALTRVLAIALVALTIAAFALAAVASMGVVPAAWAPAVVVGAAASIALLGLFFHPWLVVGVAIDVLLIWATVVARWVPSIT